jgi:uncharacterized protein (TIGR03435 family)
MKNLAKGLAAGLVCAAMAAMGAFAQPVAPAVASPAAAETHAPGDISGTWQGTLVVPAQGNRSEQNFRQVVKISKKPDGGWNAVDYSIDQKSPGMNCSDVKFEGGTLKYTIPAINGSYQGKLSADGNSMIGTWSQGSDMPLNMVRTTKETAWDIPEPPAPPKPMAADADPDFEVATIKPNNSGAASMQQLTINGRDFTVRNGSLGDLIAFAYNVQMKQIVNGPDWLDKDRFDIAAKTEPEGMPNVDQLRTMVRKLLADRFQLKFHHDKREMAAYVLTAEKSNKLSPSQAKIPLPGFGFGPAKTGLGLNVRNATMDEFAGFLQSAVLDRPVVNKTGIDGRYDMTMSFTPDLTQFNGRPPKIPELADGVDPAPDLFLGLQQQIGLKISSEKTAVDVIAIDHAEKPSAN